MAKETISELVHVHLQNTSAHGLPNMLRAKTTLGKLVWCFLFLAGIGALTWQIADRLDRFFSNEYNVKLDINFSKEVSFPAVTFCNMNPLRNSAIEASGGNLYDILQASDLPPVDGHSQNDVETPTDRPEDMMNPDNDPAPPDMTPLPGSPQDSPSDPPIRNRRRRQLSGQMMSDPMTPAEMTTEGVESWDSRAQPEFFSEKSEVLALRQLMANELSQLQTDEKVRLGHELKTMLLKCQWQGYPCAPNNFTTIFNSHFGNCYTFGRNNADGLKSNHPGPLYGLSLELYIQHDEYLQKLSDTAGIILVVHESDKMPLPEDDGILISTGLNTAVGIKQLKVSRLGLPYANCTRKDEVDAEGSPPDYYRETFGVSYSLKTCERSCYQDAVIKECDCADSAYPSSKNDPHGPCNTAEHARCKILVELAYRAGDISCNCFNPCGETVYIPSISMGYWPSDVFKASVYDDIKRTNQEARSFLNREADPAEWLEKNVAKIQIFFEEFNYETITQSPAYTLGDLLSDVGGQLGLWVGISVLSIFEIIETISAVVALLWYSLKRSGKLKKGPGTSIHVIKPPIQPTLSDNPGTLFPA